MGRIADPALLRPPPTVRTLDIVRIEPVSPLVRRITFAGPELEGFSTLAADDHVKLLLEAPSGTARRDYTPRRFDPQRQELAIEFVLHGDVPAAGWAAAARIGDRVSIAGPRGSRPAQPPCDLLLLIGDDTALPAIARRLEESEPGARIHVIAEIADAAEERRFATPANVSVEWLHRDGAPPGDPARLTAATRRFRLPPGDIQAWIAAESATARAVRDILLAEHALPRPNIRATGYWRQGEPGRHDTLQD